METDFFHPFSSSNSDNVLTARSIAIQSGIFTAGGVIMEGPVFRKLSSAEMDTIVPRLQVRFFDILI